MIDKLIRICLEHRLVVLTLAAALLILGGSELSRRPVDIFPDLNQPTVTVLAELHGFAPEEMETLVTLPLEAALIGAPGVERIRSNSQDGLSIVRADFGWDTDVYRDRQLVQERLQLAIKDLPRGVEIEMAPVSSILGQILDLGLTSPDGSVSQMELQTLAEWVVRRRLMAVPGVSQVVIIGGGRKQYQILVDPDQLIRHEVSLGQVAQELGRASRNTSGGYLVDGSRELLVRNMGRVSDEKDISRLVVAADRRRPVRVRDLARVRVAPQFPRGAAAVDGRAGVVLEVFKQPESDTLELTRALDREIKTIARSLPDGVALHDDLFRQATFLSRGVDNVIDALRDGAILVVIILFLFLVNLRASLITLVALPMSFAITGLLFYWLDLSLNTMTLGGLAIAVGELVDDAIVGVENVWRRIRLGKDLDGGRLDPSNMERMRCLVADASSEVRGPIFVGTLVVVLVFVPLFALSGIEGRLFTPLAIAYVVSLLASMVVSLTVTPVLALMLFRKRSGSMVGRKNTPKRPPFLLRGLQSMARVAISFSIKRPAWVLVVSLTLAGLAGYGASTLGTEFLPEFDEGTVLVMSRLPPGTSLDESARVAAEVARRVKDLEGVQKVSRFTGRGEHDEHAPPVSISHVMLTLDPHSDIPRAVMLERVRARLVGLEGMGISVGQPLAHRIDHLLTGVQAQVVIKVSGPDLGVLRAGARKVAAAARRVPGVTDLLIEPQVLISQVHVRIRHERLAEVGLSPGKLVSELEVAIGGETVGHLLQEERSFDIFVRLDPKARSSLHALRQLPVPLPGGGWARLGELAVVEEGVGPNAIKRDHLLRRIAVSCNVEGRSVGEVVAQLKKVLDPVEDTFPEGTFLDYQGQFAAQGKATRLIAWLSLGCLAAMVLILFGLFRSLNLALQVLTCVPMAFLGGVGFLLLTGQHFSVAALVGFVSLSGIATRNGILLVSHYLLLMRQGRKEADLDLMIQAGRERAAPVVMTALTTGVGLLPLLLSAGETGREILYPVATVVIGGLLTSTLFEFLLRPALFWLVGRKAAWRVVGRRMEC